MDRNVAAIARHGLVPALVVLWALTPRDPGVNLPEEDAIVLARYIVARYGAIDPFGFSEDTSMSRKSRPVAADRSGRLWRRRTRAGLDDASSGRALGWAGRTSATNRGLTSSGIKVDTAARVSAGIYDGPPAKEWNNTPAKPVINLEPCYEAHLKYGTDQPFDAYHVRAASYYSLFASPTAGVSYGHNAIWPWNEQHESAMEHFGAGIAGLWREAVQAPGAASMRALKHILDKLAWWRLRPAQELIVGEVGSAPQRDDPLGYVAAAKATDDSFALIYFPRRKAVVLETSAFVGARAAWIDPVTAQMLPVEAVENERGEYVPPQEGDWLLLLQK